MEHLAKLISVVGKPSANRMAKVSDQRQRTGKTHTVITRSNLDDYLRGKRIKLPDWPLVLEVLMTCKEIAIKDNFPFGPDALGTEAQWHRLWESARQGRVVNESPIDFEEIGDRPHQEPT